MRDKLESLTHAQLIQVIEWTLNDTYNAQHNYQGLDAKIKGWCGMLNEAIKYQINKAYDRNCRSEEQ